MLNRFNGNVVPFADDATSTNRTVFGGTTQSDLIDDNLNTNFKKGWEIVGLNDNPTREDFNAMGYTLGALTAYLYEMGISEWNASQNYRANSRVTGSDGKIYKALTGTTGTPNVGNNPIADTTNWGIDNQFYINSLASKATPIDADNFGIQETGGLFKKLSWANVKATLKTYFDTLYVTLSGNQTIAGVKTFNSTIVGNITGNAGSATIAADSNKLVGKNWYWSGQGGQPTWLWGGSDGTDMYVYNPANFSVNYANNAGYANSAAAFTTAVGSAPSYACRAWVNFNGTGTVAIRASGNVSSITDNGVGDYTVNFTTAMPDANYSASGVLSQANNTNFGGIRIVTPQTITSFRYADAGTNTGILQDEAYQLIAFHR